MTVSDLRLMNARQIAAFAAFEETETQTDKNESEEVIIMRTDIGYYTICKGGEFIGRIQNQNSYGNSNPKGYELMKFENGKTVVVMVGTLPACKKAAKSL